MMMNLVNILVLIGEIITEGLAVESPSLPGSCDPGENQEVNCWN